MGAPGKLPAVPEVQADQILAVVCGDLAAEIREVERCAERFFDAEAPVSLAGPDTAVTPVEFLMDTLEAPSWVAFGRVGNQLCLVLDGEHSLLLDADPTSERTREA